MLSGGARARACSLFQVASSFSHMLNLHNLTEEVNASHTERAVRLGEVHGGTRSTRLAQGAAPQAHPHSTAPGPLAPSLCARAQVENPIRTTNKSLIRLTTSHGYKGEDVYKVRAMALLTQRDFAAEAHSWSGTPGSSAAGRHQGKSTPLRDAAPPACVPQRSSARVPCPPPKLRGAGAVQPDGGAGADGAPHPGAARQPAQEVRASAPRAGQPPHHAHEQLRKGAQGRGISPA